MNVAQLLEADPKALQLGQVVDGYKAIRDVRLAMAKEVEAVEAVERSFKQHLIDTLDKRDEKGVFGLLYKAQHKVKRIPKIKADGESDGWGDFWQFVFETGRTDLVQKRLNDRAVMDTLEAGETIPGVETMLVSEISVTKIA